MCSLIKHLDVPSWRMLVGLQCFQKAYSAHTCLSFRHNSFLGFLAVQGGTAERFLLS